MYRQRPPFPALIQQSKVCSPAHDNGRPTPAECGILLPWLHCGMLTWTHSIRASWPESMIHISGDLPNAAPLTSHPVRHTGAHSMLKMLARVDSVLIT